MKKISLIAVIIIVVILLIINRAFSGKNSVNVNRISINGKTINILISKTNEEITRGLGGRDVLEANTGMFFIMPEKSSYTFWMKDMKFPIDIIWISDNQIVDISKDVPVENNEPLTLYKPVKEVNYVLEVNSGYTDLNQIKIGDVVYGISNVY